MAPLRASTRKRPSPDEVSAVAGTNGEMNPQVVCRTCWVVPVPGGQLGVWSTQQKTAGASGVVGVGMNGGLGRCASESVCSESGTFVIWRFCPPSFLGGGGRKPLSSCHRPRPPLLGLQGGLLPVPHFWITSSLSSVRSGFFFPGSFTTG